MRKHLESLTSGTSSKILQTPQRTVYLIMLKVHWSLNFIINIFKCFVVFQETLDFVAYVAKDENEFRACYVLECGRGMAQEVITSIGQAFNLRFKDYLNSSEIMWYVLYRCIYIFSLSLLKV